MHNNFTHSLMYLLSAIFILFLCGTPASAQPAQYSCHMFHYALQQRDLTEAEKALVIAQNERSDSFDILNYEISADLTSYSTQLLQANTIVLFSPKLEGLKHFRLDLEALTVDSVFYMGNKIPYNYDGRYIDITFAEALTKGNEYSVRVYYHGTPMICHDDGWGGFYFEDDVAYNLGIGIDCIPHNFGRAWFPCFDNFIEHSTYKYNIISDGGKVGYGLGELVDEEVLSGDTIKRVYVLDQPIPTYLSHIAVGPYTEINFIARSEYTDVPVQIVVKPENKANAERHFKHIEQALQAMEYWYGPYMWDLIGYHITSRGAMEHPTGIAYPSSVLGGTDIGLQTHELTHHWWGDIVTLETDADMWIKEGPATYAEQQIIEFRAGEQAFKDAVRLNNLNMIRTAHIADGGYLPLSPMPQRITYGVTTYDKAAAMFHNLRTYMGDSLFRMGMQYVLEEKTYGNINAYSFRDLLMEGTGLDLSDFFNDWILSPGWSDFAVNDYTLEANAASYTISGTIHQSQYHSGHFHNMVPLKLTAYFDDLSSVDTVVYASGEKTDFSFTVDAKPTALIVNEDYSLCLASVTNSAKVTGEGLFSLTGTQLKTFCTEYTQDDRVAVEHHFSAPPALLDESKNLELSRRHYWKIAMARPGVNSYGFNYSYHGGDSTSIDFYVARDGIDSMLLLYRKDLSSEWVEVPEYRIVETGVNAGMLVTEDLKPGLYTLGHGERGAYTSVKEVVRSQINIYPTIVENSFTIDGLQDGFVTIFSLSGYKIGEYELHSASANVELPRILPGLYIVKVSDKNHRLIHTQKIIKR